MATVVSDETELNSPAPRRNLTWNGIAQRHPDIAEGAICPQDQGKTGAPPTIKGKQKMGKTGENLAKSLKSGRLSVA